MLNLFITGKCNLNCDYCFVSSDFREDLQSDRFEILLSWLEETRTPTLAILGGEPTLHPDLLRYLEALAECGVGPVLFTNALFPESMAKPLAELAFNIVVNYNGPEMYGREAWLRRERNMGSLLGFGGKVTCSKNFAPGHLEYGYLIEGANRFGVKTIRYDLSRPRADGQNAHFIEARDSSENVSGPFSHNGAGNNGLKLAAKTLASFARDSAGAGIATGLDCCLSPCLFSEQDLADLKAISYPFEGTCRPSLDILPDLSVLHCWPLKSLSVPKVTDFDSELDLMGHMAGLALSLRREARSGCGNCGVPPSACQGGCLALAQMESEAVRGSDIRDGSSRARGASASGSIENGFCENGFCENDSCEGASCASGSIESGFCENGSCEISSCENNSCESGFHPDNSPANPSAGTPHD